jgi:RND superfamily putative drug exporter
LDERIDSKFSLHRFLRMVESGNLPEGKLALDHFTSGSDTWVQVFFKGDPRSKEARALVERVRQVPPPPGASVLVGGVSAELVDLLHDMKSRLPLGVSTVVVTIFVLLFLMLGSVVVPLKAVVLNFLSLTVTFGALVWVFQDGHLTGLLGTERLGSIDALEPMLVFVIAFGLSMDYEVFLLSRIKESFDQTGDNKASVALGVQRTGGLITSAALLLAVVILGFAAGKVLSLKQVGLGLFLAVLVDATLVRSLLVPATMTLLGRLNWWAPAPLHRLRQKLGLGEFPGP